MNTETSDPLNQLHVTPLLPPDRVGRKLGHWLRNRDFIVRVLSATALLSLLLNLALCILMVRILTRDTVAVVLDCAGNIILAEGQPLIAASELNEQIAKQATTVLLTRNPKGFRFAENLPQLFSSGTQTLAEQLRQNEQPDFALRQLRQEPDVARIEVRSSEWSGVEVVVKGVLRRTGRFDGQAVDESVPFTLNLKFTRNRNLLRSNRYPLIVSVFNLTYDTPHP